MQSGRPRSVGKFFGFLQVQQRFSPARSLDAHSSLGLVCKALIYYLQKASVSIPFLGFDPEVFFCQGSRFSSVSTFVAGWKRSSLRRAPDFQPWLGEFQPLTVLGLLQQREPLDRSRAQTPGQWILRTTGVAWWRVEVTFVQRSTGLLALCPQQQTG